MPYATLTKDGQRVAAQSKEEADKLFAQGFTLEKEAPQPPAQPPATPPGAPPGGSNEYIDAITRTFEENPEWKTLESREAEALKSLSELERKYHAKVPDT